MSALIPIDVNGVQHQAHGEFTSSRVAQEFQNSLAAFVNIFNIGLPNTHYTGVDPNGSTLSSDILAKLDDTEFATSLLNALIGGSVKKNYGQNTAIPGVPAVEDVTVIGLLNLVKDGLNVTDDPVLRPGQHFLSLEMAGALQQLLRSLEMAGVNIQESGGRLTVSGGITSDMVKNWKNLSASSDAIRKIMQYAVDTTGNQNRTLQALVELIYVKTGNELLSESLERLEDAIGVTKGSLDALNRLQTLHNRVTAEEKQKFEEAFWGYGRAPTFRTTSSGSPILSRHQTVIRLTAGSTPSPTAFVRGADDTNVGVNKFADDHFQGIDPILLGQISEADRVEFLSLRNSIIDEIEALDGQTGQQEAGTLLEKMRTVLSDINKAFSAVGVASTAIAGITDGTKVASALQRWILDSTGVVTTTFNIPGLDSGKIQRNLTAAISAGQSLNDTQKEEVRRYLFVFEEYYKSAAAILSKVTQILERMAQAIAR